MGRFRRTRRGVELRLDAAEAEMLRQLLTELTELLGPVDGPPAAGSAARDPLEAMVGMADPASPPPELPVDPVLARLLPDGYRDDPVAAAELRRYTEPELRREKLAAATAVLAALPATGGRLTLDTAAAGRWLGALNDLRLALGTRLEVTEDTYAELDRLPEDSPQAAALGIFAWLGWLQETLVAALARG